MTFDELLQRRVRADGAQPLLTCYDATSARTELSAITYANWVAKCATMIIDTLDAGPGDTIDLGVLRHHPGHWMAMVWAGAAWTAGVTIATEPDADTDISVSGPELEFSGSGLQLACSLHPLALGFTEPLPEGVIDWAVEVKGEPDVFLGSPATGHAPAWGSRPQTEILAVEPVQDRVLIDCRSVSDPLRALQLGLIGPLLGGGSAVCILGGDPDRIAESERAVLYR